MWKLRFARDADGWIEIISRGRRREDFPGLEENSEGIHELVSILDVARAIESKLNFASTCNAVISLQSFPVFRSSGFSLSLSLSTFNHSSWNSAYVCRKRKRKRVDPKKHQAKEFRKISKRRKIKERYIFVKLAFHYRISMQLIKNWKEILFPAQKIPNYPVLRFASVLSEKTSPTLDLKSRHAILYTQRTSKWHTLFRDVKPMLHNTMAKIFLPR